jgi:7,8-dihydroneopterin aldolase/epimerase/oxygenase
VRMKPIPHYDADTSLEASKNYMDLKFACSEALDGGTHFKLIEAVADHVAETLFLQDTRVEAVTVKIIKLALSEADEKIGITLHRERR